MIVEFGRCIWGSVAFGGQPEWFGINEVFHWVRAGAFPVVV